jgi:hypothetical protein
MRLQDACQVCFAIRISKLLSVVREVRDSVCVCASFCCLAERSRGLVCLLETHIEALDYTSDVYVALICTCVCVCVCVCVFVCVCV